MNTGAEAVETGIKLARAWGYLVKGVPDGRAKIIVAAGNFHGRTTTIISFSDDPLAHDHFGPYTPGFVTVPYGDLDALAAAMTPDVVAVLVEPIQGEAGVRIPPPGYLAGVRALTRAHRALFIADEIQSGLGRTGRTLACEHEDVVADVYLLGKALGGGIVPVSAVVADADVLGVLSPAPTAAPSAATRWPVRSAGPWSTCWPPATTSAGPPCSGRGCGSGWTGWSAAAFVGVRSRGLWAGVDIDPALGSGRDLCEALARRRVLVKDTHGSTIRLAPPIVITEAQLDHGLDQLELA